MQTSPDDHAILGIAADDLAGAADTAAQVASPERPSLVSLGPRPSWLPHNAADAAAFAIDADCRNVTPKDCAIRIADAFAQLARIPGCRRYLKLDSTLRGNVGAAIEAATEGAEAAILAPAFPARQRTVADGILLVNGTPVAETEVGRDGAAPVGVSEVAAIVRRQWQCGVAILSPRTYGTPGALAEALAQALDEGAELLMLDADSAEDMRDIAAAVQHMSEMPLRVLPAGSAGLARGFADVMGVSPRTPPPSPPARAMPMP
ncbi:MAG: hypothetical protein JSV65_08725, partial [Armatimonadota bacterium]